jgi:hypothetical protein
MQMQVLLTLCRVDVDYEHFSYFSFDGCAWVLKDRIIWIAFYSCTTLSEIWTKLEDTVSLQTDTGHIQDLPDQVMAASPVSKHL